MKLIDFFRTSPKYTVEAFNGADGPRWRIRHANGEILATSEAYSSFEKADQTAANLACAASFKYVVMLGLLVLVSACASLQRTGIVGGGAGAGAAAGSLLGPVGAIGGAVVGGAVTSAVADSQASQDRADRMEDKLYYSPQMPPPGPFDRFRWYYGLAGLWVWLRRAHLMDALTGKEPRWDAILRALGLRTHRTPIPSKRVASDRGPT